MKKLKKSFKSNKDHCGVHTFELIKRNDDTAMYCRKDGDRLFGYEVFKIKTRLKGQKLPGGSLEEQDRECYPGTKAFGKTAWFFPNQKIADIQYDLLINGPVTKTKIENLQKKQTNGKRGRPKRPPVHLKIPNSKFTINDILKCNENLSLTKPVMYLEIKKLIQCDVIEVAGEIKNKCGRGKPMKVYQPSKN